MKTQLLFVLSALALAGCANYQLGTTLPSHLRTVSVETFRNSTEEPNIQSRITSATLQEFQRDGQLKVKSPDEADINVTGVITEYKLDRVLADKNNPKRTSEYRATATVKIEARERVSGKRIVTQSVSGSKIFAATGDISTAKRNALPEVAKDAAKKIVDAVISAW